MDKMIICGGAPLRGSCSNISMAYGFKVPRLEATKELPC
jgi:hypothetical protein